jgi:pimeloyl-ACP methyl ester carboxylesterase
MEARIHEIVRVPDGRIAYEVRGAGPTLLMISGGSGAGGDWNGVASLLAERYTVVTYERRGVGHSIPADPTAPVSLEMHSDDAHRLLATLTNEPAYVFGSSAGALIGLDLLTRHPEQVRRVIVHEPPVEGISEAFDQFQNHFEELYQREGAMSALRQFMQQLGVRYVDLEPGVVMPQRDMQSIAADADAFFMYTFPAVHHYRLDVGALVRRLDQLVLAAGEAGRTSPVYRCTVVLAERLGAPLVEFPSHHAGYMSHPRAFSRKLIDVLSENG